MSSSSSSTSTSSSSSTSSASSSSTSPSTTSTSSSSSSSSSSSNQSNSSQLNPITSTVASNTITLPAALSSLKELVDTFDNDVFDDWLPTFEGALALLNIVDSKQNQTHPFMVPLLLARLEGEAKKICSNALTSPYNDLVKELRTVYPRKNTAEIYRSLSVGQGNLEPLETYIQRFQQALRSYKLVSKVQLDDTIQMILFQNGLQPYLRQVVVMANPTTLLECYAFARRAELAISPNSNTVSSSSLVAAVSMPNHGSSRSGNRNGRSNRSNRNNNQQQRQQQQHQRQNGSRNSS